MSNFAKLFQVTPLHQVLITIIPPNKGKKKHIVTQTTITDDIQLHLDVEFDSEDDANVAFDAYNHEKANVFYTEMSTFVSKNKDDLPDEPVIV